jgi:hypothetical protein
VVTNYKDEKIGRPLSSEFELNINAIGIHLKPLLAKCSENMVYDIRTTDGVHTTVFLEQAFAC